MRKELKDQIIDFFDPWDLVEYLGIKIEDIIEAFEEDIEELEEEIEEFMGVVQDMEEDE